MRVLEIFSKAKNRMSIQKKYVIMLLVFVVGFTFLSTTSALRKSPTCDEAGHHIASGYVFLTRSDFAFSPEVPPLSRYIIAMPLLLFDVKLPDERAFWARDDRSEFSKDFLFGLNSDIAEKMILFSRLTTIILTCFGGVFLFIWVKERYDGLTAAVTAGIFFLSPNIMAHGRLATTDIAAMVFIMLSVLSFWDLLVTVRYRQTLIAGLSLGLALSAKFSALLLLPFYGLATIIVWLNWKNVSGLKCGRPKIFRMVILCVFTAFLVLWVSYRLEFKPLLQGVLRADQKEELIIHSLQRVFPAKDEKVADKILWALKNVPVPLSSYMMGVVGIVKHGAEGASTFFMGKWETRGHPAYYLVSFFIKTPLPVIISFFAGVYFSIKRKDKIGLSLFFLGIILAFFVAASRSNLQLGLRYVLPAYPFIFIFAAVGISKFIQGKVVQKVVGICFVLWMCTVQYSVWPDYLSYFNILVGGPRNGHMFLRDSNLDWGQDLPALAKYMRGNNIDDIKLLYFGTADPTRYGIKSRLLSPGEFIHPGNEVYAVSAHYMDSVAWTKSHRPTAYAGYSIPIYDFRERIEGDMWKKGGLFEK